MEEDRMMILKMLQEGKIDADQAAKLLEALEAGKSFEKTEEKETKTGRWFRVRVSDAITGNQKTNIRIPIGLMNAGFRIGAQFSPELSGMNSEEIMNAIKAGKTGLIIDVIDDEDNEHVEIFIE
jgi:hypothetical protein